MTKKRTDLCKIERERAGHSISRYLYDVPSNLSDPLLHGKRCPHFPDRVQAEPECINCTYCIAKVSTTKRLEESTEQDYSYTPHINTGRCAVKYYGKKHLDKTKKLLGYATDDNK